VDRTTDRQKTDLLTKLGFLYLEKMGCFEISTEVGVASWAVRDFKIEADQHFHVDVLGIEWEYLPPSKQYTDEANHRIIKKPLLRGIEIKVSRSDFRNGFVHCGCHYNYLMVPKGLVELSEVHQSVGIMEVDLDQAVVNLPKNRWHKYTISGIELVRNAKRQDVPEFAINHAWSQMSENLTNQTKRWLIAELSKELS